MEHDGLHPQPWHQDLTRGQDKETQAAHLANFLLILHHQCLAIDSGKKFRICVVYVDETGRKGSLSQAFNFAFCLKALGGVPCFSPETHGHISMFSQTFSSGQSHCRECAAPQGFNLHDSGATFASPAQQIAFTRGHKKTMAAANMVIGLWKTFNKWCTQYVDFLITQWPHVSRAIVDDFLKYTCKAISAGTSGTRILRTSVNNTLSALVIPLPPQTEEGLKEQLDQLHASVVAAPVVGDVVASSALTHVAPPTSVSNTYKVLQLGQIAGAAIELPITGENWRALLASLLADISAIYTRSFEDCPKGVFATFKGHFHLRQLREKAGEWAYGQVGSESGYEDFGNAAGSVLCFILLHAEEYQIPTSNLQEKNAMVDISNPDLINCLVVDPLCICHSVHNNQHCRRTNLLEAITVACVLS